MTQWKQVGATKHQASVSNPAPTGERRMKPQPSQQISTPESKVPHVGTEMMYILKITKGEPETGSTVADHLPWLSLSLILDM